MRSSLSGTEKGAAFLMGFSTIMAESVIMRIVINK